MKYEDVLAATEAAKIRGRSVLLVEGKTRSGYFALYVTPEESFPCVLRDRATVGVEYYFDRQQAVGRIKSFISQYV